VFLSITTTAQPATDLGYLLHKHPARVHTFAVSVGQAHVFFPEAMPTRCTAALLLEVDPVGLVRGALGRAGRARAAGAPDAFSLAQYVNDRPYAASSMLAVALGRVFRTAMSGRCEQRPELPGRALPLRVQIPALPCAGGAGGRGAEVAHRVFAPLGWSVQAVPVPLDPRLPQWGDSRYVDLRLAGEMRLSEALNHLYVLLPVLDNAKHYWVTTDEVEKLVRAGHGWLAEHPERDTIVRRYLANKRTLVSSAVGRLAEVDDAEPQAFDNAVPDEEPAAEAATAPDAAASGPDAAARPAASAPSEGAAQSEHAAQPGEAGQPALAEQRRAAVLSVLRAAGAARVVDLGCGSGALLLMLAAEPAFTEVLGVDVSARALQIAERRLRLDRLPPRRQGRVRLLQSSLTYRDTRIAGYDAVVLMEVIEHVDPPRLDALGRTVFGHAHPGTVVVTTPNAEYNIRYPGLPAGAMRHPDHRFEWTRAQFRAWADATAGGYGYSVRYLPVGPEDAEVGPPTQLAVFTREGG
jgi:2-polyprenyl-3-methyl-5-hydroxy-6-metoxy-1,4-benzoquinol methylase